MVFQCINIRQVHWEVLKTEAGLGFQHLPRDLANVNARKNMFDPYIKGVPIFVINTVFKDSILCATLHPVTWC